VLERPTNHEGVSTFDLFEDGHFGGPDLMTQLATGQAATFDAAEAVLAKLLAH
jgi:hypothetical protein